MKKQVITSVSILLLASLLLVGCGKEPIIGKWELVKDSCTYHYEFKEDEKLIFSKNGQEWKDCAGNESVEGSWDSKTDLLTNNSVVFIKHHGGIDAATETAATYGFEITDNKLIMTEIKNGQETIWERIASDI